MKMYAGLTSNSKNYRIKNLQDNKIVKNSHKDSDYITIDEKNLEKVLNGEPYETYKKPIQNLAFRF